MPIYAATNAIARLPRYRRVETCPPIAIGRPKRAILEAVARYRYLDAEQLAHLLFSPGSVTYVRHHCKELFHAGLLARLYLPRTTPTGSSRAIYALDGKGHRYLARAGAEGLARRPGSRFRPSEEAQRELPFLEHVLECNSLLISAERLARQESDLVLASTRTEKEMRRDPLRVEVAFPGKQRGGGERAEKLAVIPDGWLDLRYRGAQQCIAFELDHRGTQAIEAIQRKIYGYLAAFEGGYQGKFGTSSVTVAFVAVGSPWSRVERLKSWTEEALALKGRRDHAEIFRFSGFDTLATDPAELFFSPIWLGPFTAGGVPLLERG